MPRGGAGGQSPEAMTRQFNALAADGWEYVGPVASTERQNNLHKTGGVLVLFRRSR